MCLHLLDFSVGRMSLLSLGAEFSASVSSAVVSPLTATCVCYTGSVVQVLFSISITKSSFSSTELSAKLLLFYLFFFNTPFSEELLRTHSSPVSPVQQ